MTDEVLRLGLDTGGVESGMRRADRAYEGVERGARRASDANEALERKMREAAERASRGAAELDRNARANREMAEASRQAARSQDVYARAARERLATEREVARMASGQTTVSATAAAEAFIQAQETHYRQNMARVRLAVVQGLITPEEAAQQGQQAAMAYNNAIAGVIERRPQFQQDRHAFTALAGSLKNVNEAGRSAGLGMGHLRESVASLAAQAVGAHPVLGRLANVVGSFAMGGAVTVGVLGGIAAIGLAWRKLTEDARKSREEHERLMGILDDLRERQRIEDLGPGGQFMGARSAAFADVQRIAAEIMELEQRVARLRPIAEAGGMEARAQLPGAESRLERLREEYEEALGLARAGERGITEEVRKAEEERLREVERAEAERARARREALELKVRLLQIEKDAEAKRAAERRKDHEERLRLLQIEKDAEARRAQERRRVFDLEQRVRAVVRRREEEERRKQEQAERQLAQARERALNSLVRALNNVGRAYGGVTDQVLGLVSAVLSLERMPMGSTRDRLTAFGTAAATGIGIGHTTGSGALGGMGGAAAGFSLAGPAGAIIGGVAGIVSGLTEQGRRARQAAEAWDRAMEQWERSFTDRTPFQQRTDQLADFWDAALAQARETAGGMGSAPGGIFDQIAAMDMDSIRSFVDRFRDANNSYGEYARMLEEAIRLYDLNTEAIERWRAEQERLALEDLEVRALEALGRDEEADALRLRLQQDREMQQAIANGWSDAALEQLEYVHGLELEKAAKDALKDTINDLNRALNAPSGLNLSLHRWRANMMLEPSADTRRPRSGGVTGGGIPGTNVDHGRRYHGDTYNIEISVDGSGDPRRVAREVVDEIRRTAGTGAGNPLDDVTVR